MRVQCLNCQAIYNMPQDKIPAGGANVKCKCGAVFFIKERTEQPPKQEKTSMSTLIMEANGHNGQVEMTDSVVQIKRKGVLAFISQGLKGDKVILISHISSIQFKKANAFLNGYIQFAFVGGQEAKGGIFQGTRDENSVMFRLSQQPAFEVFRDELQRRISSGTPGSKQPQPSPMDELEKLASLRDKGIVSEEEFQKKSFRRRKKNFLAFDPALLETSLKNKELCLTMSALTRLRMQVTKAFLPASG